MAYSRYIVCRRLVRHHEFRRTTASVPVYSGRFIEYLCANFGGTNRPPKKWYRPVKCRAHFFGAVNEIRQSGCPTEASPCSLGGPSSTCHPESTILRQLVASAEQSKRSTSPTRRNVDGDNGQAGISHRVHSGRKGLARRRSKAEAEQGVHQQLVLLC